MKNKKEKGITLVALVITIIILLILAGVALTNALSQNGLFQRAKLSKEKYEQSQIDENNEIDNINNEIDNLKNTLENKPGIIKEYTISFDSNGGTECDSITVKHNGTYENLPTTTKDDYRFNGWYLSEDNENGTGEKVENDTQIFQNADHTLYAGWLLSNIPSAGITLQSTSTWFGNSNGGASGTSIGCQNNRCYGNADNCSYGTWRVTGVSTTTYDFTDAKQIVFTVAGEGSWTFVVGSFSGTVSGNNSLTLNVSDLGVSNFSFTWSSSTNNNYKTSRGSSSSITSIKIIS